MNKNQNTEYSNVKSAVLPIHITKESVDGTQVLNHKLIHFQINYGRTYHINYRYFMPKHFHLASGITPEVTCQLTSKGLTPSSINFVYVQDGPVHSKHAEPIQVHYVSSDGRRVKDGIVNGRYGQTVNLIKRVSVPPRYKVYGNQQTVFKINNQARSVNILVTSVHPKFHHTSPRPTTSKAIPDVVLHNSASVQSDYTQSLYQNLQKLRMNLHNYNHSIEKRLIQEVVQHNFDSFKKVITSIFLKMDYKNVSGIGVHSSYHEVSGVVRKELHDRSQANAIYIRSTKYPASRQVTISEIRDFVTRVMDNNASKGIFITTSVFDREAVAEAKRHSIILISGKKLARLMVQDSIGVKTRHVYRIVDLDHTFFNN